MLRVPGYTVVEELYTSRNSTVVRAHRHEDDTPVILKRLNDPTPERIAWFRREYNVMTSLAFSGIVTAYALDYHYPHWMLVLEDFGGSSLNNLNLAGTLPISTFLQMACTMTVILGQVHQQRVIHKDINPSNIVANLHADQIKLIDFGLATRLTRETTSFRNPAVLEGTLSYIAPEQTGRMNRPIDYRSDFYSLGATFYELATGQVPFVSKDALELVYSHIARLPTPPHEIRPDIPEPLSAIIMKLLEKDADHRYQSAYGLHRDLDACLRQINATGTIAPFPLAQHDGTDRFVIPQHLYGRDTELATLLGTFDQVSQGTRALLLVAGAPGIGKTALVQEVYRPLTARRGTFIAGKFDQVQRNIPYLAFAQAFQSLVRHLLTEPEAVLNEWRERLTAALGPNGQVMIEVIPNLELIIGEQPAVLELGARETQNRFMLVFQQFLQVFTRPEHPLVVFLDDLQWADSGSLMLLEQILGGNEQGHLLVIGAYRDTDVPPSHLLWRTLETIRQAGIEPQTMMLGPLDDNAVTTLMRDALHVEATAAQPLASLVQQKTGGNPFFLGEFLKALYGEELLTYAPSQGHWVWNLARIESRQMTDNVVTLMIEQVQRLPAETQQTLQRAACIGSRFDLTTLAAVQELPTVQVAQQVEPALEAGLIEPLGDNYKVMTLDVDGLADTVQADYRFAHDRVQQAAYEQMPDAEQVAHHWRIGQILLAGTSDAEREEHVFDLISQLNAGRVLATAAERVELARLNLDAGRKAKESAAFTAAYDYFQIGLELLPADAWHAHYLLTLALHEEAAETAYLSGDFEGMERLVQVVVDEAHNALDTVKVYDTCVLAASTQGRLADAVQNGVMGLTQLGVILPENPQPKDVAQALQELQEILSKQPVDSLFDLPIMTDPTHLAAIQLLTRLLTPCYVAAPAFLPIIVTEGVRRSILAGNAPGSSVAYVFAGMLLCSMVGDMDTGYACGHLGVRLVEQLQAYAFKARVDLVFNVHVRNWKDPICKSPSHLRTNYQVALETGDYLFVGASAVWEFLLAYYAGYQLDDMDRELVHYHTALMQLKDSFSDGLMSQLRQTIADIRNGAAQPGILHGDVYDEHVMLPHHQATGDGSSIAFLALHKLMLAYLFDNTPLLAEFIPFSEENIAYLMSNPSLVPINMYTSLACLRLYPDAHAKEQTTLREHVEANQQQLHTWAQHAPMNFLHKWHLVEAERYRVLGQPGDAREHYDYAITGAQEYEFIQEEALASELAGRFYLARGQTRLATMYMHDAHTAYMRWGAIAKVRHLEQHYPALFVDADGTTIGLSGLATSQQSYQHSSSITSSSTSTGSLDVASIVKASQVISGEMRLDALLTRLLYVLLENAGASRGVVVLLRDGHWFVDAEGTIDDTMNIMQHVPLDQADLPHSLISYALRTGETIVLDDAPNEGEFTLDSYIQTVLPHSIFVLPLFHQGVLTGLVYLENTRATGAFTPARQEVLALLSGQVAISLENTRLYTHLEDLVEERTSELTESYRHLSVALDEAQRARATTEEANELRTRLVASMLHELRIPLNSIINHAHTIGQGRYGPVSDAQIECLNCINDDGQDLLGLINDMLDLAKIQAGHMELYTELTEMDVLVKSTLATAIGLTKDKPITLHHEIVQGLPPITADQKRIRQVLLNLLSNAAKFTDEGSITVRVWQNGQVLISSVTDTGAGIPADKLNTIFEEFRQVDDGSVRSYQGTGLGLTICKRLIEMHGGRIWVESTSGGGTTFFFSLPVPVGTDVNTTLSMPIPGTDQGTVVLVIDDDPAAIDIVRTYLSRESYAVYGITDGRAALDEVRRLQPAIILLDIIMPFINGWDILAELKLDPALQAIPVIMYTMLEAAHKGMSLGADGYLMKPVDAQQLRDTVAKLAPPFGTILAIDDDLDVLEIVQHQLGALGDYQIVTANGGQAGLDAIATVHPDLVLLDLMMPEVDGFAVLETMDQNEATRSIPVVVLSGKYLSQDEQSYLRHRVNGLVNKQDASQSQWLTRIQSVLKRYTEE